MNFYKLMGLLAALSLAQTAFAYDMADAEKHYAQGDYSTAIIHVKNQLINTPKHSKARHLLGIIYLKTGKISAAEKELGRAWKLEQDNARYRLDYAQSLLYNQKYDQLMDVLEVEIDDPALEGDKLFLLASLHLIKKQYEQAEEYFQQAIKKGNIKAAISLADIALQKNDIPKARTLIDTVLFAEPDNTPAWKMKALITSAAQQYQQAIEIYTRLIQQKNNDLSLYLQRASVLMSMHDLAAAETDIQFVLKINNRIPEANFLMAKLRFEQGDYKQAEVFSERVLSIIPEHKASMILSASSNFALNNLNKAEQRFLEYLNLEPDNIKIQNLLARVYLAGDKADSAILILEDLPEEHHAHSIEVQKTLTNAYLSRGEYNKAISSLQQAQKNTPKRKVLHDLIMVSRTQAGFMKQMLDELGNSTESYKNAQKRDYLLLTSYFYQKRFNEFKQKSAEFIAASPNDANLYVIEAKLDIYHKDFTAAKKLYNKALTYNKHHRLALLALTQLAEQQGDLQSAENTLRTLLGNDSKNISYRLLLAALLTQQPEREKELYQLLDNTFTLNPQKPDALIIKQQYQLKNKHYNASLLTARQIQDKFPDQGIAERLEANTYFLSGKKDLALQSYQKAYDKQPDAQLAIKIANTMITLGTPDDGIHFLEKQLQNQAIEHYPVLFHLSALHQMKKEYQQAIGYYQQLLQLTPENANILNDLAWTYMKLNDPRAIKIAESAYKKQPDSANIADTYGTILVWNNQIDKGLHLLIQSAKQAPNNKNTQFHLAKAYYLQGSQDKSLAILKTITQGNDSFVERAAALKLLQQLQQ